MRPEAVKLALYNTCDRAGIVTKARGDYKC